MQARHENMKDKHKVNTHAQRIEKKHTKWSRGQNGSCNALGTLRKGWSLDDADTLAYHQNKLKQAQIDLLNSQRKKSRTNYSPMLHAIMEMPETLQDKILVLCGIIFENTKTITLSILYHLKLAPTHLLMPDSGRADLLPSTPLTGTATDSP